MSDSAKPKASLSEPEVDFPPKPTGDDAQPQDEVGTAPLDDETFGADAFKDEPTRVAPPEYDSLAAKALAPAPEVSRPSPEIRERIAREAAEARASGFDREETRVATAPELKTPEQEITQPERDTVQEASADAPPEFEAEESTEEHEPVGEHPVLEDGPPDLSSDAEDIYRSQVEADISFSKSTGYDKESTAVVPLADLARREEERLRRSGLAPAEEGAAEESSVRPRALPMGEIIDVLRAAHTVEEVAGVLVEIVANILPRVLLLWQRHGHLVGFAARGIDLTPMKLLTLEMPLSVLQEMTAASLELDSFVGPPRVDEQARKFFDLLGHAPKEILIAPCAVTPADRWLLYADNGPKPLPTLELRLLEVIVARAGARADLLLDRSMLW